MVRSGRPGGDCGCASGERAGVAGLATSALPLSGPASARDGERAGPRARDPRCSASRLWVWGSCDFAAERPWAEGCRGNAGVPWGWEKEGGAGAEVRKGRAGDAFVRGRLWGFLFCPLKLAGDTEARRKQEVAPPRFVVAPRRHVVGLIARSRAAEACSRDTSLPRVDLH